MKVKNLVIVESPTKAKTIGKILGRGYAVVSSMGHLIDLPEKKLGVDIENNFQPEYALIAKRGKTMVQIKKAAKEAVRFTSPPTLTAKERLSAGSSRKGR